MAGGWGIQLASGRGLGVVTSVGLEASAAVEAGLLYAGEGDAVRVGGM